VPPPALLFSFGAFCRGVNEGGCEYQRAPALSRRQPDDRKGYASGVSRSGDISTSTSTDAPVMSVGSSR
jgi:hypothetical protein